MSDRDAKHLVMELQEARSEIDKLRRWIKDYRRQSIHLIERITQFDKFIRLAIEKTAVEVKGEYHWPDWLVDELDGMGLWIRKESDRGERNEF